MQVLWLWWKMKIYGAWSQWKVCQWALWDTAGPEGSKGTSASQSLSRMQCQFLLQGKLKRSWIWSICFWGSDPAKLRSKQSHEAISSSVHVKWNMDLQKCHLPLNSWVWEISPQNHEFLPRTHWQKGRLNQKVHPKKYMELLMNRCQVLCLLKTIINSAHCCLGLKLKSLDPDENFSEGQASQLISGL